MSLSIITINYNNLNGLVNTIESVLSQSNQEFEFIVIDGASVDGSFEYLSKIKQNFTYWVSEKDNGIYHAMNKGILASNSDYLLFLNSGDVFYDTNVISEVSEIIASNDNIDIFYGNQIMVDFDNLKKQFIYPKQLTFSFFFNSSLPHQASFIKSNLFKRFGFYDENLKVVSDWEFFFDLIVFKNVAYLHIDRFIAIFEHGGVNFRFRQLGILERETIFQKKYPMFYDDIKNYRELMSRDKYLKNSKIYGIANIVEKIKDKVYCIFK
jgi:glycosyltransferase involved in cell wall biosynthesis